MIRARSARLRRVVAARTHAVSCARSCAATANLVATAIGQFSVEDLRIMIGQRIGLPWLVPVALEVLEQDPLAEGDFYPGDLLGRVLSVGRDFWSGERELHCRAQAALARVPEVPKELQDAAAIFRAHAAH